MHLREGEYNSAHTDFFEAFKNYDESGSPRRTTCLKYLVLASMLMQKVSWVRKIMYKQYTLNQPWPVELLPKISRFQRGGFRNTFIFILTISSDK